MIEINLLPEELKSQLRAKPVQAGMAPLEKAKKFLPIAVGLAALLVCFQVGLAVVNMVQVGRLHMLKNKWNAQEPQRKTLEKFTKEYAVFAEESGFLLQALKERRVWAPKLYSMSANVPAGVWINEMVVSADNFSLQGSVLSPQGGEVNLINDLLSGLKADKAFYGDFSTLELGSVQRRMAGPYKIEDFALAGKLK